MNNTLSPFIISVKTSVLATIITSILGVIIAYLMANYRGRFKGFLDGLLTLPLVLPPTVVGFFLLLFFGKNGPFGKFLLLFNKTVIFSWSATVIAAVVVSFPMMYRSSRSAFEQIDYNIISAAKTLGFSNFRIFCKIAIPLAFPGIIGGIILSFARALGEFGATLMIAGNIPGKTQTIPLAIFFAVEGGNMALAYKWVITIVLISLISIFLLNNWSNIQSKLFRKRFK